jgi:hypothetical protein
MNYTGVESPLQSSFQGMNNENSMVLRCYRTAVPTDVNRPARPGESFTIKQHIFPERRNTRTMKHAKKDASLTCYPAHFRVFPDAALPTAMFILLGGCLHSMFSDSPRMKFDLPQRRREEGRIRLSDGAETS